MDSKLFHAIIVMGASLGSGCYEHHRVERVADSGRDVGRDVSLPDTALPDTALPDTALPDMGRRDTSACDVDACRCNPTPECLEVCDDDIFICIL